MKKSIVLVLAFLVVGFANISAQNMEHTPKTKTVKLEQTTGEFTIQSLTLAEGDYIFEITNQGVDHELGFVIAPKGKTDQASHIQNAYVQKTINDGESSTSKVVTLTKGEYVYFCPLNPTPQYSITVK